jgi:hypothetical protein
MRNYIAPCFECPDRVVGCHSACGKYKQYDEKNQARRNVYHKAREENRDISLFLRGSQNRKKRKNKK